jgi:hypothetical protein
MREAALRMRVTLTISGKSKTLMQQLHKGLLPDSSRCDEGPDCCAVLHALQLALGPAVGPCCTEDACSAMLRALLDVRFCCDEGVALSDLQRREHRHWAEKPVRVASLSRSNRSVVLQFPIFRFVLAHVSLLHRRLR